jgi:hypothetical protein
VKGDFRENLLRAELETAGMFGESAVESHEGPRDIIFSLIRAIISLMAFVKLCGSLCDRLKWADNGISRP